MAACRGAAASSSKMQVIIPASCCCCNNNSSSLRGDGGRGRRGLGFTTNAQYMNLNGTLAEEQKLMQSIISCCCCCCCCRYSKFSSVAAGISRNLQFLCSCKSAVPRRRLIRHLDFMPRDQKIYRIGDQIDSFAAGTVMKAGLLQDQAFGLGNIARGSELLDRFSQADGGAVRQLPVIKGSAGSINLRPLVAAMATSLRDQKNIDHDLVQTPESVQSEISHGSTTPEQEMMMRATSMQQPQQKVAVNGTAPSTSTSLLIRHPAAGLQQLIDHSASEEGSARLIDDGILYRQNFVIRSYEVDANRTATLETLTNLFQEAALNHVWLSGIGSDGFGTTIQMKLHDLIWVVNRLHVEVDRYPKWGDVVEIESWVGAAGKNGMRRDWIVRDFNNRQVLARSTSTWVMMNQTTRKLSKMPEQVRAEVSPYYLNSKFAIPQQQLLSIPKLDDSADHIRSGLTPRRSDLDMNQHVNNVKYINWMMESVPASLVETHEVSSITMQYRRECGPSDVLQSLTSPADEHQLPEVLRPFEDHPSRTQASDLSNCNSDLNSSSSSSNSSATIDNQYSEVIGDDDGSEWQFSSVERTLLTAFSSNPSWLNYEPFHFAHLLRTQRGAAEIVRGKTIWKLKKSSHIQANEL
ncbi:unnamed protein product [Sphagnum troendelagicum]|uniref:Acyl-[acyl-carrier-protein] hydrolase n=1 Tax=Sphagnum troendelagicum TaxID=128251 RepID=A0ABP0TQ26_9BRYO